MNIDNRQLLMEIISFDITADMIAESLTQNNGRLLVKGVLQRSDAENQNGRFYPDKILRREADRYAQLIKERRALGELDHPDSSIINLNNVSHNILEMHWEGKDLVGTVEILTTPSGNILRELFKCGIKLGISSRGLGSVRQLGEGKVEVQEDFELIGFDFVSNPSTHGAFLAPINGIKEATVTIGNILTDSVATVTTNKYVNVNRLITDILSLTK